MKRFKEIETLFEVGFDLNTKGDAIGACDKWLKAWDLIKGLFSQGVADNVFDLNSKYNWKHFPSNYAQFLEMELRNAGVDDKRYHQKRIDYCLELLQWCGKDDKLTINNTRIALGEAHFDLGDETGGEKIFKEWINEDPDCGWAYSGWASSLRSNCSDNSEQYEKAEEVLLAGYSRSGLYDKGYVVDGLVNLYNDMGKIDKAQEFEKISMELQSVESNEKNSENPEPVKVAKVGRNEPCPCGSGKKYKKCCLP